MSTWPFVVALRRLRLSRFNQSAMDTIVSRPESTTAAAATTSRPACDFTEPERCRVRALDKAHEYDKENGGLRCQDLKLLLCCL